MWRRFGAQQQQQHQQPIIGNPTLIETTVDEGYLETIHEVESIISRQNSVRHPSQLPDLPFRSLAPQPDHHDRTSSVYSQPSPPLAAQGSNEKDGLQGSDTMLSEVSSLTLHSSTDDDPRGSPLVSPISPRCPENDHTLRQEHPFRSQLPRRVPESKDPRAARNAPSYRKQPANTADKKRETRWDDFSGEPTDSEDGKPAVARPGVAPLEVQYPQLKERTKQILAGLRDRAPANKQGLGAVPSSNIDNLAHPAYREPWKGASGRVAIVEPVKNTPVARLEPLRIPQQKLEQTQANADDSTKFYNQQPTPRTTSPKQTGPTIRPVASQDSIKPIVPLKLGSNNNSRVVSPVSPLPAFLEHNNTLQSPFKSPQHTFLHPTPELYARTVEHENGVESPTDDEPLTPTTPTHTNTTSHMAQMDSLRPPVSDGDISRFSWTTYNTTEQGSPNQPSFDSPDVPPMPSHPSILLRKRPVPSYTDPTPYTNPSATYSNASVVVRKPVPAAERNRSASMASTPSMGKSLPQCPPELEASDKITTLEARLDDLSRRKRNINKIKAALTESLRRNAVAYDAKKRKEVESKLKNLDSEMSEVTQEEHEVGLRLHRAQKKKDREENNLEPTSLWIKRVTS